MNPRRKKCPGWLGFPADAQNRPLRGHLESKPPGTPIISQNRSSPIVRGTLELHRPTDHEVSADLKRNNIRHEAIRQIVRTSPIRTQLELVEALRSEGFTCTQATISRDISDMHLRKLACGVYVLDDDLYLQRILSEFVTGAASGQNIAVIHVQPKTAPQVAQALDSSHLEGLLGTIAGDDTVLAVADTPQTAESLCKIVLRLGDVS